MEVVADIRWGMAIRSRSVRKVDRMGLPVVADYIGCTHTAADMGCTGLSPQNSLWMVEYPRISIGGCCLG